MAGRKGDGEEEAPRPGLLELLQARESQPGARGAKLREFLACKDEIAEAVRQGYTIREIWQVLTESGRVTMTYGTFGDYLNRLIGSRGGRVAPAEDDGVVDPEAVKRKRLVGV